MNLVLQGGALSREDLTRIAASVGANHIVSLGVTAWRLTGVTERAEVEPFCAERQLDFAWVPDERRLADLRLLVLDMDSTLITIECIDEMGGLLGRREAIAALTARAMRGEIDYVESLRRRVALLAGLEYSAIERLARERLRLSPGAEALLGRCRDRNIHVLLVSGGFTLFTAPLQARLGIDAVHANELEFADGRLTGRLVGDVVDGPAKARCVRETLHRLGARRDQAIAIGDGANDLPMLQEAGVSVAWRAKPLVRERATHALDYAGLDGVLNLFL